MSFARLADDEEGLRKGLSLEKKGEGERLWEKASFPLCV